MLLLIHYNTQRVSACTTINISILLVTWVLIKFCIRFQLPVFYRRMRLIQVFRKWTQLREVPILLTEVFSWFILPTKSFCSVFMTFLPATSPRNSPLSISSKTTGFSFKSPTISKNLFPKQSTLQQKHLLICSKLNTNEIAATYSIVPGSS